jgi:hypothetical protein
MAAILLSMMTTITAGTRCLRASTYKPSVERKLQELEVRRLTSDGRKAIVHHVICPTGIVEAVDLSDLIVFDSRSGFWIPRCRPREEETAHAAERHCKQPRLVE